MPYENPQASFLSSSFGFLEMKDPLALEFDYETIKASDEVTAFITAQLKNLVLRYVYYFYIHPTDRSTLHGRHLGSTRLEMPHVISLGYPGSLHNA